MQHSIVNQKDVFTQNDWRIDPEFYHPSYLCLEKQLKKSTFTLLGDCCSLHDGPFGSDLLSSAYSNVGVPALRMQNITNTGLLNINSVEFITNNDADKLVRHIAYPGEVVVTKIGFLGFSTVLPKDFDRYFFRREITRVEIKDKGKINPYYLATFFNIDQGRQQALRFSSGTTRDRILLTNQKEMIIPLFSFKFQTSIENICKVAYKNIGNSKDIYNYAENFLLSELGLTNWRPKHALSFVKNYSDTAQAQRFDAEYYQPKYEKIVKAIKNYKGGWDTLGDMVTIKKCVEVGSGEYQDEGIPFVRVSNISPFELTEEKYISEKLYSELTQHQPKQGEILFSKDATPGIAHYLNDKPGKMIPSGGILRLKLKDNRINEDYLTLVLNSLIVKEQINRDVGGSVILHWRPDQVKETLIPLLPKGKQAQIQKKVSESFALRKQSRHLLECAKKAVEMAIEQDEKTALQWLKKQTKNNWQ